MWYTSPWFIILCSIALLIILFFIWAFIKAAQLSKLIINFSKELVKNIPADNSDFNFEKTFTIDDSRAVATVCKLDNATIASRSNKIDSDIIEMLDDFVEAVPELKNYDISFNVEILKSKIIFSAYCYAKDKVLGD